MRRIEQESERENDHDSGTSGVLEDEVESQGRQEGRFEKGGRKGPWKQFIYFTILPGQLITGIGRGGYREGD